MFAHVVTIAGLAWGHISDLLISRTQVTGSGTGTWYPFSFSWPVG